MPQFDTTGPVGKGPTGLGRGGCVTTPLRGGGQSMLRGRRFCPYFTNSIEALSLEDEKRLLKERLKAVEKEIERVNDSS